MDRTSFSCCKLMEFMHILKGNKSFVILQLSVASTSCWVNFSGLIIIQANEKPYSLGKASFWISM